MKMPALLIILSLWGFSLSAQSKSIVAIVYFATDKYAITPEIKTQLDSLVNVISNAKISGIFIYGFCDDRDDSLYNMQLSERRAGSVSNYFIAHGIDSNTIKEIKAFGENIPVNNNSSENERALNRRVEIQFEKTETTGGELRQDIAEAKVGDKVILKNMNFYPGSSRILPESVPVIDSLFDILQDNPTMKVQLVGHICCITDATAASYKKGDGFNMDTGTFTLSFDRAFAVRNYLTKKGIDPDRILYIGKGGSQKLVDPEITEADKQSNRRVEVWIVQK